MYTIILQLVREITTWILHIIVIFVVPFIYFIQFFLLPSQRTGTHLVHLYYSIKRAKSASTPCGAPACPSHARTHSVPLPPPLEAHDFSAIVPPSSHCMPHCDPRPLPTAPTFDPRTSSTIHRWSFHLRHPTSIVGVHDMPHPLSQPRQPASPALPLPP